MGIQEMNNITLTVTSVLKDNAEARDDDRILLLAVWELCGLTLSDTQKWVFMEKCPYAESVRRVRQKLQEQGMYHGTKRRARAEEERAVRAGIGSVASQR